MEQPPATPPPSTSPRAEDDHGTVGIRVTNLDSVQQAQTWRRHGPDEAVARTVAMIRSALLLCETIVLDRNQLLDGVVLLALGPEELRWHLGLPPRARLPLVVTAPASESGAPDIDEQLSAVTAPGFTSAAEAALSPLTTSPLQWLLPEPQGTRSETGPAAARSEESEHGSPLSELQPSRVAAHIAQLRTAWMEAMRHGDVAVRAWKPITLSPHLVADDELLARHPVIGDLLDGLEPTATRSTVLRALDRLRETRGDRECRGAFRWWTQRYYDAICDANAEYRISFSAEHSAGPTSGPWEESQTRGRWARVRSRLSVREVPPRSEIPFEGEIVENMRIIAPSSFHVLRSTAGDRVREFWQHPSNRKIWDLVLTVRRSVASPWIRRDRMLVGLAVRFLAVLAIAVLLGLKDIQVLPSDTVGWLLLWAGLAFVVAFPWATVRELGALSPLAMTATLRIADHQVMPHHKSTGAPVTTIPPWRTVWRAQDFDLAVERSPAGLHRVVTASGRPGAVALCRLVPLSHGAREPSGSTRRRHESPILFVRARRPAVGRDLWELPRGFGSVDEADPVETALRETAEETGYPATARTDLGSVLPDSGLLGSDVHVVLLDVEEGSVAADRDGEAMEVAWFTPSRVRELVRTGEVRDGITLAALHLAETAIVDQH